ncbi:proteasome inhibitor PI31 subunit [Lates japonicus]
MAGLEVLYTCVAGSITCPQDAVVCFVHWEMIKSGFRCVGSGDAPSSSDKKSELLPPDWSSNKELYSLRYKPRDGDAQMLLKAISVDSTLIFNLMNSSTQQVSDLTVNISEHVDVDQLHTFDSVFKDADSLSEKVKTQLLPPPGQTDGTEVGEEESEGGRGGGEAEKKRGGQRPPPHAQQTSSAGNAATLARPDGSSVRSWRSRSGSFWVSWRWRGDSRPVEVGVSSLRL